LWLFGIFGYEYQHDGASSNAYEDPTTLGCFGLERSTLWITEKPAF